MFEWLKGSGDGGRKKNSKPKQPKQLGKPAKKGHSGKGKGMGKSGG